MKISLLTPDSKRPNLAIMKISAWHKANKDQVELNFPLIAADFTYASVLFNWTIKPIADEIGGTGYDIQKKLDPEIDRMKPDYSLYPKMDYSLGYTYKACPRTCDFCVVPKQKNEETHYSIWDFHNQKFNKICLLNNNTLADPDWRETFNEIINANLVIVDDNGYDARLFTDEVADYFKRLKWNGYIHTAWDFPEHEIEILNGLYCMKKAGIKKLMVYILIGHTTHEENMHRIILIDAIGFDPFVMPLNKHNRYQADFARWVNFKAIFKTVKWEDYQKRKALINY